jgi:hypothetical protein
MTPKHGRPSTGKIPPPVPLRAAQAAHALMEAWSADDGSGRGPLTAAQVHEYDRTALTVQSTGAALAHARRLGLVDGPPGLWFATAMGWSMRRILEDLVLGSEDE